MKMAKNRLKTGPPQRYLNTGYQCHSFGTLLISMGGPLLFAAKSQHFESSVKVKFLRD